MIKNHKALFVASLLLIFVATTYQVSAQGTFSPTASFKFTAGTKVKTTSNLKVRLTASIYSQEVGTQSVGAVGTVVAGPIVSNGYTWWKYDFLTGADGWAVDDYVSSEQATSVNNGTVAPTTGASNVSTKFQGGDSVQTTATVNVRVSPGTGSSVLGQQVAGAIGTLPNGTGDIPMYVSGYWWWRVNFNSGASGWVVENYLVKAGSSGAPAPSSSALPTVSITASPNPAVSAQLFTLTWSSTNAVSCIASGGWSGAKATGGSQSITAPTVTASYPSLVSHILDCKNSVGSANWSKVDVTTNPASTGTTPPTNPTSTKFQGGDSVQTTATVNVRVSPGTGSSVLGQQLAGAIGTLPNGTGDIPMYVSGYWWWRVNFNSGASGWVVENYLVKAGSSGAPAPSSSALPTVSITASPNPAVSAQLFTLTWSSTNAVSCIASGGWSGAKATGGSQSITAPTVTASYPSLVSHILDCKNSVGSANWSKVDVTTNPASTGTTPPTNPTSTKFQGGDSVQTTATVNVRVSP